MGGQIVPIRPGEILTEEFLQPLGVTQSRLAVSIDVPSRRINEIVRGMRRITADTALRLRRFFGTSAQFWVNLQSHYDPEVELNTLGDELIRIQPLHSTWGLPFAVPPIQHSPRPLSVQWLPGVLDGLHRSLGGLLSGGRMFAVPRSLSSTVLALVTESNAETKLLIGTRIVLARSLRLRPTTCGARTHLVVGAAL